MELNTNNIHPKLCEDIIKMIINDDGYVQSVPYDKIKNYDTDDLNYVMLIAGLYTFPTTELIEWLREQITDDPDYYPDAIEIGAGTGWIGRELEIPATDSKLQDRQDIKERYAAMGQPTIMYPNFVEKLDAVQAIKKYRPEFVLGSYITHKWKQGGSNTGNMYGVNTDWVINNCHKFFLIGNLNIVKENPSLKRKHLELSFPWLITRGDYTKARIFVWESKQWNG